MRDDCWGCKWFNTVGICNYEGGCTVGDKYEEIEEEDEE